MTDLLSALGHAAAYSIAAAVLLVAAYFVLDLATPGHLGKHLRGWDSRPSFSAGVVTAAWLLSTAAVLFTAIWTNGDTSLGWALLWTLVFGALGIALNAAMLVIVDLVTPGNLREIVCTPGPVQPLALVAAATAASVAVIVCASIA